MAETFAKTIRSPKRSTVQPKTKSLHQSNSSSSFLGKSTKDISSNGATTRGNQNANKVPIAKQKTKTAAKKQKMTMKTATTTRPLRDREASIASTRKGSLTTARKKPVVSNNSANKIKGKSPAVKVKASAHGTRQPHRLNKRKRSDVSTNAAETAATPPNATADMATRARHSSQKAAPATSTTSGTVTGWNENDLDFSLASLGEMQPPRKRRRRRGSSASSLKIDDALDDADDLSFRLEVNSQLGDNGTPAVASHDDVLQNGSVDGLLLDRTPTVPSVNFVGLPSVVNNSRRRILPAPRHTMNAPSDETVDDFFNTEISNSPPPTVTPVHEMNFESDDVSAIVMDSSPDVSVEKVAKASPTSKKPAFKSLTKKGFAILPKKSPSTAVKSLYKRTVDDAPKSVEMKAIVDSPKKPAAKPTTKQTNDILSKKSIESALESTRVGDNTLNKKNKRTPKAAKKDVIEVLTEASTKLIGKKSYDESPKSSSKRFIIDLTDDGKKPTIPFESAHDVAIIDQAYTEKDSSSLCVVEAAAESSQNSNNSVSADQVADLPSLKTAKGVILSIEKEGLPLNKISKEHSGTSGTVMDVLDKKISGAGLAKPPSHGVPRTPARLGCEVFELDLNPGKSFLDAMVFMDMPKQVEVSQQVKENMSGSAGEDGTKPVAVIKKSRIVYKTGEMVEDMDLNPGESFVLAKLSKVVSKSPKSTEVHKGAKKIGRSPDDEGIVEKTKNSIASQGGKHLNEETVASLLVKVDELKTLVEGLLRHKE